MDPSDLLVRLSRAMETLGLRYFVTGSTATVFFGEPRFTNDIDVVVELPAQRAADFCAQFPGPEFYVDEHAVRSAAEMFGQFNIIHPESGLKIGVMVPDDSPFNRSRFIRAVVEQVSEAATVRFASPEDVILKKLEYHQQGGADKHLRDITGVLRIRGVTLDREYVSDWAARLGLSETWNALIADYDARANDVTKD